MKFEIFSDDGFNLDKAVWTACENSIVQICEQLVIVTPRHRQGTQCSRGCPHPSDSAVNQRNSSIEKPLHTCTVEKSERPEQNRDLRCQSGPSAKDSVIFSGGDSSKNYGADQQRLQISDLHFDKFPTPATFACWKIRFKTEVCT